MLSSRSKWTAFFCATDHQCVSKASKEKLLARHIRLTMRLIGDLGYEAVNLSKFHMFLCLFFLGHVTCNGTRVV